ncbi:hypothetical protein FORC81_p488 (plasmid) [Escherichia coli]|nr:hypothetical protein FORC81_p488 [Escherichia coli]
MLREKELLLAEKDKRNEDLKQALLLIESKLPATPEPVTQPMVKNHGNSGKNRGFSPFAG